MVFQILYFQLQIGTEHKDVIGCGRMGGGYSTNDENGRSIRMLYDEHKEVIR